MDDADKVAVRTCEEADIAAITAIYANAVREGFATFEIDPPDEAEMADRRRAILSAGYPFVVAEIDGLVAGYAYAGAYRARAAFAATVENSVYVRDGMHGRGIGAALMRRLVDDCATRGFRQMIAVIGDSDNVASIRLHDKLGFRFAGLQTSVGWKLGRWLDTVTMQLPLGEGDSSPPADCGAPTLPGRRFVAN